MTLPISGGSTGLPSGASLGEGEMGPGVVVVREIRSQDVSQVAFAQDDDVVETVASNGADQPLSERILPNPVG